MFFSETFDANIVALGYVTELSLFIYNSKVVLDILCKNILQAYWKMETWRLVWVGRSSHWYKINFFFKVSKINLSEIYPNLLRN